MLGSAGEVVGGKLDLVAVRGALAAEELVTTFKLAQRVFLAIVGGKGELMEAQGGGAQQRRGLVR